MGFRPGHLVSEGEHPRRWGASDLIDYPGMDHAAIDRVVILLVVESFQMPQVLIETDEWRIFVVDRIGQPLFALGTVIRTERHDRLPILDEVLRCRHVRFMIAADDQDRNPGVVERGHRLLPLAKLLAERAAQGASQGKIAGKQDQIDLLGGDVLGDRPSTAVFTPNAQLPFGWANSCERRS